MGHTIEFAQCASNTCLLLIEQYLSAYVCRGDIVTIETYFSADGRIAARREWSIKNAQTGELLGRATR